ncbi:hypothetical protein [Rhizobium tubonense]|uniref:Uncharacterized protein n=1 Tax=Rhizobium tubonense TaxID=484088 RepID=A0A2W4DJK6_9HYPH|nr:hypothetical protein [Rhizobium tubonense]PZM16394.1 hypothetical protein CPY51_03335 [Rhizobium tubonense]
MKPPWKYLAQLVSRKRTAETPEQPIARESDSRLIEVEALAISAPLLASPEAVPSPDDIGPPFADQAERFGTEQSESEEIKLKTIDDDEEPKAKTTVPPPAGKAPAKPPRKPRSTFRKTGGNLGGEAGVPSFVVHAAKPVAKLSPPADPFVQEAANLDDEIKHLRTQLVAKLQAQNAQLRKMLERF